MDMPRVRAGLAADMEIAFAEGDKAINGRPLPERVAILGLGPSVNQYLELAKRSGARRALWDEVWGINALGDVFRCDRVFHMDDVRIQQVRAAARPESNIAQMLAWLKTYDGLVYTSRPHPDYPALVAYPLAEVVKKLNFAYFNSTAAYAVAFALWLGVRELTVFGNDFTYPNVHDAEKGRACVEFWLGMAAARGVRLRMPRTSSLMDACHPEAERLYGYDTVQVKLTHTDGRLVDVSLVESDGPLPAADEIEARYDHSAHPNPLIAEGA